jgi:hypothetical protein
MRFLARVTAVIIPPTMQPLPGAAAAPKTDMRITALAGWLAAGCAPRPASPPLSLILTRVKSRGREAVQCSP